MPTTPITVDVLDDTERRAAYDLFRAALHVGPVPDKEWPRAGNTFPAGRVFGVRSDAAVIGTAASFATRTTVPGGARPATAAVSRVAVRADHTRRGVLSALMATQLDAAAAAGEVLAVLGASESAIYGRYGYGVATRGRGVRVAVRHGAGWRPGAPGADRGGIRMLDRAEAVAVLAPLHERFGARRPGGIDRPQSWWWGVLQRRLDADDHVVIAVHTDPDGHDDGYLFAFEQIRTVGEDRHRVLEIEDLHAAGPAATAALWAFALSVDLVYEVQAWRPRDEPVELLLADPRDCATTELEDALWLRLVDVPAALAARSWGDGPPLRLAVHDRLRPANTGVYTLGAGTAVRTGIDTSLDAAPDLVCDVAALAMAYLGDRRPSELVETGWWTVPGGAPTDPELLARADAAFDVGADVPWCGTGF